MASGTIKMYSRLSDMEARVYWQSTGNSATNTSTLTMKYQVKYIGEYEAKNVSYEVQAHGIYEENTGEIHNLPEVIRAFDNKTIDKGIWYDVHTATVSDIQHDTYGKARITITVVLYDRMNSETVFYTQPQTEGEYCHIADLGTITRWAYITSASNFNESENPTISYTNPAGATNLQACISFTGARDDIAYRSVSGGRYTFNLTDDERETLINAVTSGNTKRIYFYLKSTKDGVTYYKSVARTFSLTDAFPVIEPAVFNMLTEQHELTGSSGALIRYASIAAAQSNATAKYNGSIVSQKITNGGTVVEDGLASFDNVESNIFTFEATDNRGNKATKEYVAEPFIEYFLPTCNQKIEIEFDTDTETEAKVHLEITGTWFNSSFGAKDNDITVQFRHRNSNSEWTGQEWTDVRDVDWEIIKEGNTYRASGTVSGLPYDEEHVFQCRVIDKLKTTETSEYQVTLIPVFDWGKQDFTFNVPVHINGNLSVSGNLVIGSQGGTGDSVIETGTEAMGTDGTWYWEKWSSGKAVCWGTRNYGDIDVTTAWGSNGWYESAGLTQNFPVGLFIAEPDSLHIDVAKASNGVIVSKGWNSDISATNTGTFSIVRISKMTVKQVHLGFYATGRWN